MWAILLDWETCPEIELCAFSFFSLLLILSVTFLFHNEEDRHSLDHSLSTGSRRVTRSKGRLACAKKHGETCVACIVTFDFLASLSISVSLLTSLHEYSFGMVHCEEATTVVSIFCSWHMELFYTRFQPVVGQHCTLKCVLVLNWW